MSPDRLESSGRLRSSRSTAGTGSARPLIGVLALQGDVREHLQVLADSGADPIPVRRPEQIARLDGLVLPGGESTTIDKLSRIFGLREPLRAAITAGLPTYGSCAGMIMLASKILDGRADQQSFGGLDITVRRNAFGRQVNSFEDDVSLAGVDGGPFHAIFIRAPWVESCGPGVRILGQVEHAVDPSARGRIVAVEDDHRLATSFHPEVSGDNRLHRYFVAKVRHH